MFKKTLRENRITFGCFVRDIPDDQPSAGSSGSAFRSVDRAGLPVPRSSLPLPVCSAVRVWLRGPLSGLWVCRACLPGRIPCTRMWLRSTATDMGMDAVVMPVAMAEPMTVVTAAVMGAVTLGALTDITDTAAESRRRPVHQPGCFAFERSTLAFSFSPPCNTGLFVFR